MKIMRKLCCPMSINQLSPVVDNRLSTIVNNRISAVVDNTLSTVPLENLQLHSEPFSHRPDLIWNLICFRTQTFVAVVKLKCFKPWFVRLDPLLVQDDIFMNFPSQFKFGYVRLEIGLMFHELAWTN